LGLVAGNRITYALGAGGFDTVASEAGKAFSGKVLALQDMSVRSAGHPGGVSGVGTTSGAAAALVISMAAAGFDIVKPGLVIWLLMAALIGTMIESLLRSGAGLGSGQAANLVNTAVGGSISVLLVAHIGGDRYA
jgi:uncharacterized membrane protein